MNSRRLGEFKIKPFLFTVALLFSAALFIFTRFSFETTTTENTAQNRDIQMLSDRVEVLESEIRMLRDEVNRLADKLEAMPKPKPTPKAPAVQNQNSKPNKTNP